MAALARLSQADPSPSDPAYTLARLKAQAAHAVRLAGGWSALEAYRQTDRGDPFDRAAFAIVADLAAQAERDRASNGLTDVGQAAAALVAAEAEAASAWARYDAKATLAEGLYPPVPDLIRDRQAPAERLAYLDLVALDDLESRINGKPITRRQDAFNERLVATDRIDEALGVNALEAAWHRASEVIQAAAAQVVAARPVTVQDAALKYATLLAFRASIFRGELTAKAGPFVAFLSDLEALAA